MRYRCQPQIEVATHDAQREIEQFRLYATNRAITWQFRIITLWQRSQVVDEIVTDGLDVCSGLALSSLSLLLAQHGLRIERHLAIVDDQLEISPCTDGFDGSILLHEDILATVVAECRVGLGDEIVTVVDDGIIVAGIIIYIVIAHIEICNLTEILVCHISETDQVSTQLTQKDGAVGQRLQLSHHANH